MMTKHSEKYISNSHLTIKQTNMTNFQGTLIIILIATLYIMVIAIYKVLIHGMFYSINLRTLLQWILISIVLSLASIGLYLLFAPIP